jgi:hypothetical protein
MILQIQPALNDGHLAGVPERFHMMFNNRFVMAIRVNGKILRETNQTVMLPFGAEYELLLKNLNSRRAMVGISIDGERTSDCRFVIPANSEITVERYIKKGNLDSGNKFQFIERNAAVENHRGIGSDDGLVRAEFWAEREVVTRPRTVFDDSWLPSSPYDRRRRTLRASGAFHSFSSITGQSIGGDDDSSFIYSSAQGGAATPGSTIGAMNANVSFTSSGLGNMQKLADVNDAGITVPGGISNQSFHHTSGFELETNSTVIVLQLRGEVGAKVVTQPVTVAVKPVCTSCGKTNKATSRFCTDCGTGLQLV